MAVNLERDGHVATVTISRPEALNAFNTAQLEALLTCVHSIDEDPDVRAVVLTGEGDRAFAAGADIKEMSEKSPHEARAFAELGHRVCSDIEASPQPWIAAVNGYALGGGCEIALSCDIRLASEKAQFGQPEVSLGIPPGWGAMQRLTRLLGRGLASEIIFTGRRLKSDEAHRIGLVNVVYPDDELVPKAMEMAHAIAANAPIAVSDSKRAIRMVQEVDQSSGLAFEVQMFALAFATEDQTEGMKAFLEKRQASFKRA